MSKFLKLIQVVVFLAAIIGFYDLINHPRGYQYTNVNFNISSIHIRNITAVVLIILLFALVIHEILKDMINYKYYPVLTILRVLFIGLMFFDINIFLRIFNFDQAAQYFIILVYTLPVVFVIKDLIQPVNIRWYYLLFFGLGLTIPILLYFQYFYEPYEDYWHGIPIQYVHYRIRNWICFIGFAFILVSIFRQIEIKLSNSNVSNKTS